MWKGGREEGDGEQENVLEREVCGKIWIVDERRGRNGMGWKRDEKWCVTMGPESYEGDRTQRRD